MRTSPWRPILGERHRTLSRTMGPPLEDGSSHSSLENYLPDYIFCHSCKQLHTANSALLKDKYGNLPCRKKDFENLTHMHIYETFSYPIFQLAMKRHRLGLDPTDNLNLLRYNNCTYGDGYTHQCVASPRIINGSLFVRDQHNVLIEPGQEVRFPVDAKIGICPHMDAAVWPTGKSGSQALESWTAAFLRCKALGWNDPIHYKTCIGCRKIICCGYCPTELKLNAEDLGEHGVALVATKWQNFGRGEDPMDLEYKTHLKRDTPLSLRFTGTQVIMNRRKCGHIRSKFEDGKEFDYKSLLTVPPAKNRQLKLRRLNRVEKTVCG